MKVLVTGGNGLVGAYLVSLLLQENHDVTVFDQSFDTVFLTNEEKAKTKFIKGDLAFIEHVFNAVKVSEAEAIFHLGSMLSVPCEQDHNKGFNVNGLGVYYILEAARVFNVKQVIYSSTLTTYGTDIPESGYVDDRTLQRPTTIYGITKLLGESLGRYYRERFDIDFRAVRFSAIVGPGAKSKHIAVYNAWMIEKSYLGEPFEIFVKPETKTTLTYYKDAAKFLLQLSKAPKERIKTVCYNLPGQPCTAQELAERVAKIIPNAKLSYKPEEEIVKIWEKKGFVEYDGSKALEEWDWRPSYSIDEMILDFGADVKKLQQHSSK
jgi:threonine 3-dehydrogenase